MSAIKPILLGCSGPSLTQEEGSFFAQTQPFGFILFARNCETPEQIRTLTRSLRSCVGRPEAPIFIDQEGGRVARLKQPHWPHFPAMRRLGVLYERDPALGRMAVHLHSLVIARMLRDLGINGNCAPVLDLLIDGASDAIGDRAISARPEIVADCARVAVDTYLSQGVYPVIKHMPGHGRVQVDPHIDLPFVDCPLEVLKQSDFVPFEKLKDAPIGMNCHVVFRGIDSEQPVSLSPIVHRQIIRGDLGFEGLLFSDDMAMGAIRIPLEEVAHKAIEAGADVALYCSGKLSEMRAACANLPDMGEQSLARWERAQMLCQERSDDFSATRMMARLDHLLSLEF